MSIPTPEQRQRDTRLAWIIVVASGAVVLVLVAVLAVWGWGQLARSIDEQQRSQIAARQDAIRRAAEEAPTSVEADRPLPVAQGPAPPNTARPVGSPAAWIGPDDYPPSALRNEWEGRVKVTVAVDQAGNPTGCAVRRSSGHWSLDNATCAVMLNHGRFDIAPRGQRVRYWTSPVIRWALPADDDAIARKTPADS